VGNQPVNNAVACDAQALYVYCVVPGRHEVTLGPIGLEGSEVCTVRGAGMSAVVHECPARPYRSEDRATVEQWVAAHHRVVETAWERFGSVLPMSFDMMVRGNADTSARENLNQWMLEKRDTLARRLERFARKAEYGVQISWDPKVIAADVLRSDSGLQAVQRENGAQSPGLAYLGRVGLEKAIAGRMEKRAAEHFRAFYDQIRPAVQDIRVERLKKTGDGTQMLLNVSCLVPKGDHAQLGGVLDRIAEMRGMKVNFTGPWPPYSFVSVG